MAYELGIDYERLNGAGKTGKARELVRHFAMRGLLAELVEFCQAERPNVEWPQPGIGK